MIEGFRSDFFILSVFDEKGSRLYCIGSRSYSEILDLLAAFHAKCPESDWSEIFIERR